MATFAWNESYSVRVAQFDAQHRKLFELVNRLADAMRVGKGNDVIREVVDELAVYTRTHFLQEEVAMQQTKYPGYEAHHAQHSQLLAEVEKFKGALMGGGKPNVVGVLNFLRLWLVEHIQKSDQAYSAHLNAHGVR